MTTSTETTATLACGCRILNPGPRAYAFVQCAEGAALANRAVGAELVRTAELEGADERERPIDPRLARDVQQAVAAYWAHIRKES